MNTNKSKILLISIIVLIIVILGAIGGYYYLKNKTPANSTATDIQSAIDAANSVTDSATQGVLPSIGDAINPLTNKPDINPTSKTNPFQ
ncbi:hypothetical protein A2609_01805 [Candidatus Kaiserbacteria bacterium RIFOXYD1_FULL_47_14]|uniref:Uncharacterized protein n=1 Tax=Candidatus Kaiserbacteria bacterium RIFOXYD1_FULL_47_14 TaxID=1798533 RepID=A0A1F6G5Q5_9BACT|nr:MAG: hypothetical protein A2609_01805 [Candidatus Kaiserbacteria bacterium RIFOXYD1_FULL_47_14]